MLWQAVVIANYLQYRPKSTTQLCTPIPLHFPSACDFERTLFVTYCRQREWPKNNTGRESNKVLHSRSMLSYKD